MNSNCFVRQAQQKDSKRIWEIRNDPSVRQASSSQDFIPFETHVKWFENMYFQGKNNLCFIVECRGNIAGYCRFDFNDARNIYTASIAVDPVYQGKGLGHQLLSDSLLHIRKPSVVHAAVKKGNPVSVALFKKNDFIIDREDNWYYYFRFTRKV